jgi:hypothetical protein
MYVTVLPQRYVRKLMFDFALIKLLINGGGIRHDLFRFGVSFDTHLVRRLAVPCCRSKRSNEEVVLMRDPERYPWQAPYVSAILETDEDRLRGLLYEAIAAIEQRRLSPVPPEEEVALADAEAGIQVLISERTAKYV